MDTAFSLAVAVDIAVRAPGDQVRTLAGDGVEPYVSHPLRAMAAVHDDHARAVAVFHDVLEDTEWKASDLRAAGVPAMIVEAVLALTRHDGESYESFIERVLSFGTRHVGEAGGHHGQHRSSARTVGESKGPIPASPRPAPGIRVRCSSILDALTGGVP